MKKNLFYLFILAFGVMNTACSDDDDNGGGNKTNTSFVITYANDATLENVVTGYFAKDGKCKKIAELGNLKKGDTSKEVTVDYDVVKEVYVFFDTPSPSIMWSIPIKLEKGKKTTFTLTKDGEMLFANPKDDTKYPH